MRQLPGLGTITSSAALQKPEIVIRPDPERAADPLMGSSDGRVILESMVNSLAAVHI